MTKKKSIVIAIVIVCFLFCIYLYTFNHTSNPLSDSFSEANCIIVNVFDVNNDEYKCQLSLNSQEIQKFNQTFEQYMYKLLFKKNLSDVIQNQDNKIIDITFWKDGTLLKSCLISQCELLVDQKVYKIQSKDNEDSLLSDLLKIIQSRKIYTRDY